MTRYPILPITMLAIASFAVSALAQAPASTPGFSVSGSLHDARVVHTATLLKDGRVLVAGGGQGPDWLDGYWNVPSAELFDPVSGSFTPAGTFARQSHTGTLLPSGKVLLAGGDLSTTTAESELYDPVTGQFQPTGSLVVARESHTATLLQDGRVLMVGGVRSQALNWVSLSDAEIYDPVTGTFSLTGSLKDARYGHTATLLPSGKVLITGGFNTQRLDTLASAELYDPATGVFALTGSMSVQRFGSVATLLLDGHVLITGDRETPELYDPATASFEPTGGMLEPRLWHTATLLRDGTVLITGGYNAAGIAEIRAEIYDPVKRVFTSAANPHFPRVLHTATSLSNGSVAIIGGADSTDGISLEFINSAEIYGAVGSISGSPNPCVLSGIRCTTYLTWSTSGISNAQVWVRVGDGPETDFANEQSCGGMDCPAPWIEANGAVYTFTLYTATPRTVPLLTTPMLGRSPPCRSQRHPRQLARREFQRIRVFAEQWRGET